MAKASNNIVMYFNNTFEFLEPVLELNYQVFSTV